MDFELGLPGGVREVALPSGLWSAGGGPHDTLHLPGTPAALFKVRIEKGLATLEAAVALVVGAVPLPANVKRLWLPGEVVTLGPGLRVRRAMVRPLPLPRAGESGTWPAGTPTLTCIIGAGLGRTWALGQREVLLGRSRRAHVRVTEETVSRDHATLVQHGEQWLLLPRHAKNPTRVNGRAIRGARVLADGDVLELGTAALRFHRPAPEPSKSSCPRGVVRTAIVSRVGGKPRPALPAWAAAALLTAGAVAGYLAAATR